MQKLFMLSFAIIFFNFSCDYSNFYPTFALRCMSRILLFAICQFLSIVKYRFPIVHRFFCNFHLPIYHFLVSKIKTTFMHGFQPGI